MTSRPADSVSHAFDVEALSYDAVFEENPITRRLRPLVWNSMRRWFRPGDHVLDINCGTGTDAVMLARLGVRVTAIDSSEAMIRAAQAKSDQEHLGRLIRLCRRSFETVDSLEGGPFDGAISNFGGLNCADDPAVVLARLASVLKPGSGFVACLLNRICLGELAAFLARGKFRQAFRRLRQGRSIASVGGGSVSIRYYSPSEFDRIAAPWFKAERRYGMSILSPGPNSISFAGSHPRLTGGLLRLDDVIREISPWRSLGDHFVVEYRRIDAA